MKLKLALNGEMLSDEDFRKIRPLGDQDSLHVVRYGEAHTAGVWDFRCSQSKAMSFHFGESTATRKWLLMKQR